MDAQLEAPAATAGAQDARMMEIDELAEDPDSMEDIQHHDEPAPPLEVPQELSNPPQNTAQTTDTPVDTIPPTVGETHDGNSEMRRNNNEAEEKGAGYMESIAEKVDQEANVPPEEPQMADQDRVRPVLELKESPADAEPSEHQAMEGIHEEEAIVEAAPIENSSSIPPLVGPSEIDHEHVPAVQANEADLPSIPVTVSEASPLPNAVSSQAVNSQAVDQQMVDQQALEQQVSEQRAPSVPATVPTIPAAFPASIRTDQHPLNLEGNLTSALTSLPSPGGSEDPFNLKSGDGVFDESVNAKVERSSRHSDHVDNDGLADFSIPESRFAGVILPKSDRRTFREYIPADEVKHTQSLKITLKRPEGWTAPMFKVEEPPYPVAGRRRGGVGRQVKSVAYRNENDTFDDDHPAPSPSRRRKGKKAAKEEAELYGEVGRENKWKNSSSAILSGSDTGSHDQDGFIEIDELDDVRGDNRKKKEREPVRQSGRIAQKFRPSMAEDQMDRNRDDTTPITDSSRKASVPRGRKAGVGHSKISYNVDDEEIDELARSYSEDSISTSPAPLKQKTTRGRKGKGKKVIDSDDDYTLIPEKAKSQDLDHEVDEDVLIYHRELCDKCFRPSAKDLLKPKKKRGGRKRKKDEFDEGSGDEAERLLGWIECERCTSAFHWACLPGQTRTKALIEDKLLPSQEQIFYKGAPRTDDTLLLVCPHCENELIANCMKCETSDPLPYVAPARTADKDQQPVEIETGIATAMDVDETSETAQVKTDAKIDRQMESEKADQTEGSTPAVVVDGPTVEEQPEVNGKQETGNLQTQQAESDKPEPEVTSTTKKSEVDDLADVDAERDELEDMQSDTTEEDEIPLLFRCITCKRCAHYQHLEKPPSSRSDISVEAVAAWYQEGELSQVYKCMDCRRWDTAPEYILGWRSNSTDEVEQKQGLAEDALDDVKLPQTREYLVKWRGKAFRHATWVPHDYMASVSRGLLLNFLRTGIRVTLATESQIATKDSVIGEDTVEAVLAVDEDGKRGAESVYSVGPPTADPDAREKIPVAWTTPDRILDVFFLKSAIHALRRHLLVNPNATLSDVPEALEFQKSLKEGVKPDDDRLVSVNTAERLLKRNFSRNDAAQMIKYLGWVYIKWQDLQYEAATWDTPIPSHSPAYTAFQSAFEAYLWSRTVVVPVLKPLEAQKRDSRPLNGFVRMAKQPSCVVGGELMDFQLEGLNWLMAKWHNLQSCILADDMGLGKTVQISAFLAYLGSEAYHVYPHLVVVPNSTLQNWTRELAKWAPHLRVVPYFGEKGSRNVIREYELYHDHRDFHTLKTHVIVTTYEVITSKDFNVFAKIPRWETLIVDEAQRLKAGSSLIFKKLNELNAVHKVLLTGTPLNNTIREILNLMNFLDPREFSDLDGMEKRYSVPDEELYKELRAKIAPFMLRRSKEEVLDLPAKNEIIVPLTMRSLQKQVYRSILERNADLMEALARISKGESKGGKPKRGHIHNMLMQLRKCLQHPFLCNNSLEDYNLEPSARHQALIDGSAKLGFLKAMLPKLRAKGHRILLFSQFKIALDIIEQFFDGEDYKYLRLDGDTPQAKRQKDIDAFNAPDSPYTVFLLSTRAGGVGINLASADTVIIHDLDFNPHLDMQAIARSYRYGQKKTVMVFRLMMAQTVEANIMQASKKKLLLDHLIVQSLRKVEEEDDFATIVLNGAKALFEDKAENDIVYSSEALDNMISELETREKPETQAKTTGFTFAPVYETAQKPAGELPDFPENSEHQDSDFWADVLKRMEDETRAREAELYGAGKRSRGKQISYADHGLDPGNSQEQRRPAETEALHADRVPDDAASQESDYAVEHSDISDAEGVEEIQADTQELADPPSKRAKLAPPKLALHPSNGDIILKKGSNMEGESTGEQVVSVGPAESDAIKKTVRRPRKSKPLPRPNIPSNLGQFPPGPHTAPVNSASQNKLQLARAQITDLRYAAEDCAIPDYVQKTHAIFSLKLNAAARWDAYVKLAGEVDSVLEARGLAPAFMNNESVETVLPLFRAEGNDARKPINSNGRPPKIHKTKPSRPSTAVQSTNSTPSRGAPSPFTVGQRSSYSANAPSQLSTMPQSSIDSAATTLKLATSRRKRKKGFPKSRSQGISAESSTVASKSQEATVRATAKPKKDSQRPTGNPGPTCFFCTQSHETTKCPGLSSRAKIGEYAIKVQESEGSIADKAQWIRWLTDKERGLRKSEHTVNQHAKMDPSPKPVLRKRSSSSEKKAKADQQKAKEDQEVEKLVGLDDLIVIEDSD